MTPGEQYDNIYRYFNFKNTPEAFDEIEWDGQELNVILDDEIVETLQ